MLELHLVRRDGDFIFECSFDLTFSSAHLRYISGFHNLSYAYRVHTATPYVHTCIPEIHKLRAQRDIFIFHVICILQNRAAYQVLSGGIISFGESRSFIFLLKRRVCSLDEIVKLILFGEEYYEWIYLFFFFELKQSIGESGKLIFIEEFLILYFCGEGTYHFMIEVNVLFFSIQFY